MADSSVRAWRPGWHEVGDVVRYGAGKYWRCLRRTCGAPRADSCDWTRVPPPA